MILIIVCCMNCWRDIYYDIRKNQRGGKEMKQFLKQKPNESDFDYSKRLIQKNLKRRYRPRFGSSVGEGIENIMIFIFAIIALPFNFVYAVLRLIFGGRQ